MDDPDLCWDTNTNVLISGDNLVVWFQIFFPLRLSGCFQWISRETCVLFFDFDQIWKFDLNFRSVCFLTQFRHIHFRSVSRPTHFKHNFDVYIFQHSFFNTVSAQKFRLTHIYFTYIPNPIYKNKNLVWRLRIFL